MPGFPSLQRGPSGLLALVLAGCSAHPVAAPLRVADSAGIHTVQIPDLSQIPFPSWSTRLVYSTEGNDSLAFAPTVQGGFTADSNLWLTAGAEAIVLDGNGHVKQRIGRSGDGPGEFRQIFHLGVSAAGTVIISDFGSGRMAEFRPTGELLHTVRRLGGATGLDIDPVTQLSDGRILVTSYQQRPNRLGVPGLPAGTIERDSAPLILLDSAGAQAQVVGHWAGRERVRVALSGEAAGLPLRFGRTTLYDGRSGFTAIGPTDSLDVSLFQGTQLVMRLVGPFRKDPPTPTQVTDWERAVRAEDSSLGAAYLGAISSAPQAPALPAFGALVVDDAGNVWVGQYSVRQGTPRAWWVFSRSGAPLGRLELPAQSPQIMPGSPELLDVAGGRLAVRRQTAAGDIVVDVYSVVRP